MRPQTLAQSLKAVSRSSQPLRTPRFLPRPQNPQNLATSSQIRRPYSTPNEQTAAASSKEGEGSDLSKHLADSKAAHAEAEKKLAELQAKLEELQKDQMYQRAEVQTLTRRIAEEKAKASEFAITAFARALLSTSDVLTTALSHVPQPIEEGNQHLSSLFNGVSMTQKAMHKTFEENGVKKMEVEKGTAFDPNLHEATFHIPPEVAGKKPDGGDWGKGEVVEVSKEGWTIGNRVLRPAQVGITQLE